MYGPVNIKTLLSSTVHDRSPAKVPPGEVNAGGGADNSPSSLLDGRRIWIRFDKSDEFLLGLVVRPSGPGKEVKRVAIGSKATRDQLAHSFCSVLRGDLVRDVWNEQCKKGRFSLAMVNAFMSSVCQCSQSQPCPNRERL